MIAGIKNVLIVDERLTENLQQRHQLAACSRCVEPQLQRVRAEPGLQTNLMHFTAKTVLSVDNYLSNSSSYTLDILYVISSLDCYKFTCDFHVIINASVNVS